MLKHHKLIDFILCSNNNILYNLNNESKHNNLQYFRNKLDELSKADNKLLKKIK